MAHLKYDHASDTLGFSHLEPDKMRKSSAQRDSERLLNDMARDTANSATGKETDARFI